MSVRNNDARHFPNLTVAEYFAGIGLIRMGLSPLGWRVVWANDISEKKHEIYTDFFRDKKDHYVIQDIFKLDPAGIPPTTIATCSFPCIDLSVAGNMNGIDGRHSGAFWGFVNILKAQGKRKPPLVLVENVPGWLHSNGGADFRIAVRALNEIGYACDVFTLNAQRFTPQSRLRVFLVGARLRPPDGSFDLILGRPESLLPTRLGKSLLSNPDLEWFHNDLPEPPPMKTRGLSDIVERIDESDERWWPENQVSRHLEMMEKSHSDRVFHLMKKDRISCRTFFRRKRKQGQRAEVRRDDLSGCLRTAAGGSGKQFLIVAGKGKIKMRAMTAREYARLQGVPDNHEIRVGGARALTGFGDAVCVPVITWIAQNVLNPLAEQAAVSR